MKVKSVQEIQEVLQPIADEMQIEIVEVEFKQGREPALTVYIDIEGGVDLNTCEAFHRAIDPGRAVYAQRVQPGLGQTAENGA